MGAVAEGVAHGNRYGSDATVFNALGMGMAMKQRYISVLLWLMILWLGSVQGVAAQSACSGYSCTFSSAEEKRACHDERRDIAMAGWVLVAGLIVLLRFTRRYEDNTSRPRSTVVRYQIPGDLTVLESAFLLDKFADDRDYPAMILELAHLGYVSFVTHEGRSILWRVRTDTSDRKPLKHHQEIFLEALFAGGESFVLHHEPSARKNGIRDAMATINMSLSKWAQQAGYTVGDLWEERRRVVLQLMVMIPVLLGMALAVSRYERFGMDCCLYLPMFLIPWWFTMYFSLSLWIKLSSLLAGAGVMAVAVLQDASPGYFPWMAPSDALFNPLIVAVAAATVLIERYYHVGHYTPKGLAAMEHLRGLKRFIRRAKKDEIAYRLKEDPHYVERLLPYAMLLGSTRHWMQYTDLIADNPPAWYTDRERLWRDLSGALSHGLMGMLTAAFYWVDWQWWWLRYRLRGGKQ